jgi:hypothetical protein
MQGGGSWRSGVRREQTACRVELGRMLGGKLMVQGCVGMRRRGIILTVVAGAPAPRATVPRHAPLGVVLPLHCRPGLSRLLRRLWSSVLWSSVLWSSLQIIGPRPLGCPRLRELSQQDSGPRVEAPKFLGKFTSLLRVRARACFDCCIKRQWRGGQRRR